MGNNYPKFRFWNCVNAFTARLGHNRKGVHIPEKSDKETKKTMEIKACYQNTIDIKISIIAYMEIQWDDA